ncbi:flagellar basal body P-ring protein FlgI [Fimbriimonadia bacterium ATM]|nr:flagellar basal body P-ring protein FlgI [Fimbriimonadia bacterium ATM]
MRIQFVIALAIALAAPALGQGRGGASESETQDPSGMSVRVKDITRVRGVRYNQITNLGVVVGLEGTGDTRNSPWAQQAIANLVKDYGISLEARQMNLKNVALVMVTAELPPFARPGNRIDVTVSSVGDAKSLQGGYLLPTPLYGPADKARAYAVAMGPVSIGGFNASQGGTSSQKNHVNVGIVTNGALVENSVPTEFNWNGSFYLELLEPDFTTASRIAEAIMSEHPGWTAVAKDAGGVEIRANDPNTADAVAALSAIENVSVVPDTPAVIVINERTGTIVVGGNVKIGPAMIAHGGLTVKINEYNEIVQPPPLSGGQTGLQQNTEVKAKEETVRIGVIKSNATIDDLAKVFRALRISPRDMIAIIQGLKAQGAIKATIKTQ